MMRNVRKSLAGKWRIIEMELWGGNFLDMLEPACIAFDGRGSGEFRFGCVAASLDCAGTPGGGLAEPEDDASLTGEIRFHNGDESTFKARQW